MSAVLVVGLKTASSRGMMTVSQTRTGRRPISVEAMLTKDEKGELFKKTSSAAMAAELEELLKEARLMQAIRNLSGTGRMMQAAGQHGLGDVAQAAAKASAPAARATAFGKQMRMLPAERVQAAGHAVGAGEGAALNAAGARMGGTSFGQRMVGGSVEGASHHVGHKSTLGLLTNPLGVPLGGAIEGATRQGGREFAAGGHAATGAFLQKHAPKAGLAGEIAGMAGLGTMAHAPLSGAGALGTAALKGLGVKSGLVGVLGQYGAHTAADAVGTAMHAGIAKAPGLGGAMMQKAVPFLQRATSVLQ